MLNFGSVEEGIKMNVVNNINWPFKFEDVESVDENGGSTFIKLITGDIYSIDINKCKDE
jgi:hypothetical protein